MKPERTPACQIVIRALPFKKEAAAHVLGCILGGRVRAVVHQAKMRLDPRERIQRMMFLGEYEPEQTRWFKECIEPGDIVVDVGASFGYYTALASALVGPSGKVFAFEPSPVASGVIEETIRDSGIRNIVLTKAAVGKAPGIVPLFLPNDGSLHSPSIFYSDPAYSPVHVPMLSLDGFDPLKDVPKVKMVKIDVEGYEPDVLDGMERMVRSRRIENVLCEFNSGWLSRNSTTPERLLARFLDLGFAIREKTALQRIPTGKPGETFDLQDFWFRRKDLP
ncbi:MAG: FkbM family methyltransferase [Deltaproteobacteria bacterium]|nr:FkbM family methyltransferase [Deltaproteobacteria bacterium]